MHSNEYTRLPASISELVNLQHLDMVVPSEQLELDVTLRSMSHVKQVDPRPCPGMQSLTLLPSLDHWLPQLERLVFHHATCIAGLILIYWICPPCRQCA